MTFLLSLDIGILGKFSPRLYVYHTTLPIVSALYASFVVYMHTRHDRGLSTLESRLPAISTPEPPKREFKTGNVLCAQ